MIQRMDDKQRTSSLHYSVLLLPSLLLSITPFLSSMSNTPGANERSGFILVRSIY